MMTVMMKDEILILVGDGEFRAWVGVGLFSLIMTEVVKLVSCFPSSPPLSSDFFSLSLSTPLISLFCFLSSLFLYSPSLIFLSLQVLEGLYAQMKRGYRVQPFLATFSISSSPFSPLLYSPFYYPLNLSLCSPDECSNISERSDSDETGLQRVQPMLRLLQRRRLIERGLMVPSSQLLLSCPSSVPLVSTFCSLHYQTNCYSSHIFLYIVCSSLLSSRLSSYISFHPSLFL